MHFDDIAFAAIDFESSGFGPGGEDSPIQIGIASLREGKIDVDCMYRSFICPKDSRPISHAARSVHRISEADLENAPSMLDLWPEIRSRLQNTVVVAHGAGTEKRFLRAFPMHGFGPWLDTLQVAKRCLPNLEDYSLSALVCAVGLEPAVRQLCPDLDWHDALFDAAASLILLRHLIQATGAEAAPLSAFGVA